MNGGVQVFLYPEELDHTAPDELAAQVLELGCDVSVSVAYHRARRVPGTRPRQRADAEHDLHRARPEPLRLTRAGRRPLEALLRFREACDRAGVRFRAWVVGLHNDDARGRSPRSGGAPAGRLARWAQPAPRLPRPWSTWPRSQATSPRSSAQRRSTSRPASTRREAAYTLTLSLEPLSERARLLGAQCFCESCRALLGGDAEARARAAAGPPFGEGTDAVLAELAAMRATSAARLLAAAASVHEGGSSSACSSPARPSRRRCRVAPVSVAAADALLFGCGPLAGEQRSARFAGLRALAGRSGTVSTNWTPERTELEADVGRLAAAGAEGLALQPLARPSCRTRGVPGRRACLSWRGRALMVIDGHVMLGEGRAAALSRAAARDDGPPRDRPRSRLPGGGPSTRAKP